MTAPGPIAPKSRAGIRNVPLIELLRRELIAHRLQQPHPDPDPEGIVFSNHKGVPFASWWVSERATRRWHAVGLAPIGLHECRHTYAAFINAAGVNPKALSTYMGHSSIIITLDRHGHLMPGNELQATDALQHYLNSNTDTMTP